MKKREIRTMPEDPARRGGKPLYRQIKEHITGRVNSGEWPADTRIPSENKLVATLGVSRMTVNRALRELTGEGLLHRVQGVGTFVARPKPQAALLEIKSIAEEIRSRGGVHTSDILLLKEEKASRQMAAVLGLAQGAPVFHALLVHRDRGLAIQMAERWVNPAAAPEFCDQDYNRKTPSDYLLQVAPVTEVEHVVEAVVADEKMGACLEIEPGDPCLVLHRTVWSGPLVASCSRFVYPGARYRIGGRFTPAAAIHGL